MTLNTPTTMKTAPPPPAKGGFWGALVILFALGVLLVVFTASSSLIGSIEIFSRGPWWRLGLGFGVTFFFPLVIAFWLRRRGGRRRRGPRGVTMILLFNLFLGGALVAGMPDRTRQALTRDGHWWVEAIVRAVGVKGASGVIDASKLGVQALARLIPGEEIKGQGSATPSTLPARALTAPPSKRDARVTRGDLDAGRGTEETPHGARDASGDLPHDTQRAVQQRAASGEIIVRFATGRAGIVVPVVFEGPAGKVKVSMLFDTGASLTTIDARTLSSLGLHVPPMSPTITTSTANGKTRSTLVVIPAITLGDLSRRGGAARVGGGLAVALCEPCASGGTHGLLGLNFSRHFAVTVDHDGGKLTLRRKEPDPGNVRDLRHFVDIKKIRGLRRGDRFTVTASVFNRSPYPMEVLRLAITFAGGQKTLASDPLGTLRVGTPSEVRIEKTLRGPVGSFSLRVIGGRWELPRRLR